MDIIPFINIEKSHSEPISSLAFSNYTSANENILLASASNDKTEAVFKILELTITSYLLYTKAFPVLSPDRTVPGINYTPD